MAAVAGVVCCALLLWLAFDDGGYFAPSYQWAGAVAFAVLAVLCALCLPHFVPSTHAVLAFGALAALAAWTGLSSWWSPAPAEALHDLQRALLYVGLFGLAVVGMGHGRHARPLVWAVLAVLGTVALAGLASRLWPGIAGEEGSATVAGGFRLSWPLGYWNALGGVAAAGLVLGAGLAADARSPLALRGLASGVAVACGWTVWLSLSRGSMLAAGAGLVALVLLSPRRGGLAASLLVVGAATALGIARLAAAPALVDDPALGQAAAGRAAAPILALLVCGAIATQVALAIAGRSPRRPATLGRPARLVALGVVALAAAGGLALQGAVAQRTTSASSWLDRQWADFLAPTTAGATGTARLTTSKGTRSDLFRVAFDGFEAHPLRGDGAGGFEVRWYRSRRVDEQVRDAHSLELQTLGELGAVGGLLLLGFLAATGLGVARARRRPGPLGRAQVAAAAAAMVVWLVHSAVDWDWQVPAFTGAILVLAATVLPEGRVRARHRQPQALGPAAAGPPADTVPADWLPAGDRQAVLS